jgi:hypothetical protein
MVRLALMQLFALAAILIVPPPARSAELAAAVVPVCAKDENIEPFEGRCAKVQDRRAETAKRGKPPDGVSGPDLRELRAAQHRSQTKGADSTDPPVPGGTGAGTGYNDGDLEAKSVGELYSRMYVHPDGLKPTTGGLDHIYTTDTSRMDDGPEVLVWYTPRGRPDFAAFRVYDWSCSSAYPCPPPENYTMPAFVTIFELSDPAARCNLDVQIDNNGHAHQLLYFASITRKLDNGSPPLWVNRVLLWNYCDKAWDLHYEHQYRLNADNCAFSHTCGGWAAILEIFESSTGEPYPEIRELGFERSRLLHDGVWSELPSSETNFVDPVPPWKLFHRVPNRGYGAGNFVRKAAPFDVVPGKTKPCVLPKQSTEVKAAILSSSGFKPANIDKASIRIGRNGTAPTRTQLARVNGDSVPDLVLYFRPNQTGLVAGDTKLSVLARTLLGGDFGGVDTIKTTGCS